MSRMAVPYPKNLVKVPYIESDSLSWIDLLTSLQRRRTLPVATIQSVSSPRLAHKCSHSYLYVMQWWKVNYQSRGLPHQVTFGGQCVPRVCLFGRAYRGSRIRCGGYRFLLVLI